MNEIHSKNMSIFDIVNKIIVVKTERENTGFPHFCDRINCNYFSVIFPGICNHFDIYCKI